MMKDVVSIRQRSSHVASSLLTHQATLASGTSSNGVETLQSSSLAPPAGHGSTSTSPSKAHFLPSALHQQHQQHKQSSNRSRRIFSRISFCRLNSLRILIKISLLFLLFLASLHRMTIFESLDQNNYNNNGFWFTSSDSTQEYNMKQIVSRFLGWWMGRSPNAPLAEHLQPASANTTLALLVPPGLLGGYRNQVIRFMGWVAYAHVHNYTYGFLPSLLWSTQLSSSDLLDRLDRTLLRNGIPGNTWYPIPMEWVFDIEYWNEQASFRNDTYQSPLPILVKRLQNSDCWSDADESLLPGSSSSVSFKNNSILSTTEGFNPLQHAALIQGHLTALQNVTHASIAGTLHIRPRRMDLLEQVQHCQHPVVYGGGKGAGRLWNDYIAYTNNQSAGRHLPGRVDEAVLRALRPAPHWRALGQTCVSASSSSSSTRTRVPYMVVHARVEIEMMKHTCGMDMERNLTLILDRVTSQDIRQRYPHIRSLVVAVSREGMFEAGDTQFAQYANDNIATLNRYTKQGNLLHGWKVLECGQELMEQYYAKISAAKHNTRDQLLHPQHARLGSLVEQVVNFDIAIAADVFVGVKDSSYSNSVWTTRYYLGRGEHNYRYTRTGVERVIGLPDPHSNCKQQPAAAKKLVKIKSKL